MARLRLPLMLVCTTLAGCALFRARHGASEELYYVLGGIIFQELSRQYLKEWGPNWQKEAPQRLVYLDRFQSELFPEGHRKIVILSQVLPANTTIGYDDFSYLTVTKVNGKEINSLRDLAESAETRMRGKPANGWLDEHPKADKRVDGRWLSPRRQPPGGLPALMSARSIGSWDAPSEASAARPSSPDSPSGG